MNTPPSKRPRYLAQIPEGNENGSSIGVVPGTPMRGMQPPLFGNRGQSIPKMPNAPDRRTVTTDAEVTATKLLGYIPEPEDKQNYDLAKSMYKEFTYYKFLNEEIVKNPTPFLVSVTGWLKQLINGNTTSNDFYDAIKKHYINPSKHREFEQKYASLRTGGRRKSRRNRRRQSKTKRNNRK